MPKITQQALERRRSDILDAATRCFARRGIHTTTMRDIFLEAGLSAGAVYNYFPTKDDIISGIEQRERTQTEHQLTALSGLADNSAYDTAVSHFFSALADMAGSDAPKVGMMMVAEATVNPQVAASIKANRAAIRGAIVRIVEHSTSLKGHETQALSELVFAAYQGLAMSLALGEEVDTKAVGTLLQRLGKA